MPRQNQLIPLSPLPETSADLVSVVSLSLNDEVHRMLLNGLYAKVKPYLGAAQDAASVTGKVWFDRGEAARITKQYAEELDNTFVADHKMVEIDHALGVATRRMNIGRQQRLAAAKEQLRIEQAAD